MDFLPSPLRSRFALMAAFFLATCLASLAEGLQVQPTPFSVWVEFPRRSKPAPPARPLPIWLESIQSQFIPESGTTGPQMRYRLHLRRMPQLHSAMQLRLYFEDKPGASPIVSAWTETGRLRFQSPPLGTGLHLSTSALLNIPVVDTDYVEITVPGDGGTLRGAFVSSLKRVAAQAALDFLPASTQVDPFGKRENLIPQEQDTYLFGRVRATLEPDTIKLEPGEGSDKVTYEVELEAAPLLSLISFEILDGDIEWPPEVTVNDVPLGPVTPLLPDLADPAYRGDARPAERDMRFHYTGWLRCQRVVPASALRRGLNRLTFRLNRNSGPVAIRVLELQLKYPWQDFDYTLTPK